MNRNACVAIGEAIKPLETWQTEKILVPVGAIQLEDGVETIDTGAGAAVNLADYIGKDCKKKATLSNLRVLKSGATILIRIADKR
jgi:hypothetical protein